MLGHAEGGSIVVSQCLVVELLEVAEFTGAGRHFWHGSKVGYFPR